MLPITSWREVGGGGRFAPPPPPAPPPRAAPPPSGLAGRLVLRRDRPRHPALRPDRPHLVHLPDRLPRLGPEPPQPPRGAHGVDAEHRGLSGGDLPRRVPVRSSRSDRGRELHRAESPPDDAARDPAAGAAAYPSAAHERVHLPLQVLQPALCHLRGGAH